MRAHDVEVGGGGAVERVGGGDGDRPVRVRFGRNGTSAADAAQLDPVAHARHSVCGDRDPGEPGDLGARDAGETDAEPLAHEAACPVATDEVAGAQLDLGRFGGGWIVTPSPSCSNAVTSCPRRIVAPSRTARSSSRLSSRRCGTGRTCSGLRSRPSSRVSGPKRNRGGRTTRSPVPRSRLRLFSSRTARPTTPFPFGVWAGSAVRSRTTARDARGGELAGEQQAGRPGADDDHVVERSVSLS